MNSISFIVRGAPQPKKAIKTRLFKTGQGENARVVAHHYKHPKTREAEETFIARAAGHIPAQPFTGPIRLELLFVLPLPQSWSRKKRIAFNGKPHVARPDLDNLEKVVKDACNGAFWIDDKQVCDVVKRKIYGSIPSTEVTITELP